MGLFVVFSRCYEEAVYLLILVEVRLNMCACTDDWKFLRKRSIRMCARGGIEEEDEHCRKA